jgi:hypothetical protein
VTRITVDTSEVMAEAGRLIRLGAQGALAMDRAIGLSATALRDTWRGNAASTAGAHGVHYPSAITSERKASGFAVEYEVGPDPALPQGGMSFEYGSRNQPPHLDGQRAADAVGPTIDKLVSAAIGQLL